MCVALVELQNVREAHARDMAELNAQLSAALSAGQGMSTVEEELARLRLEQSDAVATLTDQLQLKDVEIAECQALIAESERNRATNVAGLDRGTRELAALQEAANGERMSNPTTAWCPGISDDIACGYSRGGGGRGRGRRGGAAGGGARSARVGGGRLHRGAPPSPAPSTSRTPTARPDFVLTNRI